MLSLLPIPLPDIWMPPLPLPIALLVRRALLDRRRLARSHALATHLVAGRRRGARDFGGRCVGEARWGGRGGVQRRGGERVLCSVNTDLFARDGSCLRGGRRSIFLFDG